MSNFSLYRSSNIDLISRSLRWAGHVDKIELAKSAFKILTCKPTGKRPLGRPRLTWDDNIKMDLKEMGINMRNWIDSAQGGETL
jgi:hypothetical protein